MAFYFTQTQPIIYRSSFPSSTRNPSPQDYRVRVAFNYGWIGASAPSCNTPPFNQSHLHFPFPSREVTCLNAATSSTMPSIYGSAYSQALFNNVVATQPLLAPLPSIGDSNTRSASHHTVGPTRGPTRDRQRRVLYTRPAVNAPTSSSETYVFPPLFPYSFIILSLE